MIEFKQQHEYHIMVYVDDSHCLNITKCYHHPWACELVMECPEEQLTSPDLRAIADKLDELNGELYERT